MTTAVFHILLSLVDETRHGYAIMREVETQSGGAVKLGPGTLYGALQRLLDDGWIGKRAARPPKTLARGAATIASPRKAANTCKWNPPASGNGCGWRRRRRFCPPEVRDAIHVESPAQQQDLPAPS
jgi:hypothetical protein